MKAKKWEDTVISDVKMIELERGISRAEGDHKICKAQAKITGKIMYKAGYEQREKEMNLQLVSLSDMLLTQRQAGIREVVEWIRTCECATDVKQEEGSLWCRKGDIAMTQEYLKTKLKDWGISEHIYKVYGVLHQQPRDTGMVHIRV